MPSFWRLPRFLRSLVTGNGDLSADFVSSGTQGPVGPARGAKRAFRGSHRRQRQRGYEALERRELMAIELVSSVVLPVAEGIRYVHLKPTTITDSGFVGFYSTDNNLVPGDTNRRMDVFVKGPQGIKIASVDSQGNSANNSTTNSVPLLSSNGRFAEFFSSATNLLPSPHPANKTFIKDLQTGTIDYPINSPLAETVYVGVQHISDDGRYLIVNSSEQFVPEDTNNLLDIYLHNRVTGEFTLISANENGLAVGVNLQDTRVGLTADYRYFAFYSDALNLAPGDTPKTTELYLKDMQTGQIELAKNNTVGIMLATNPAAPQLDKQLRFQLIHQPKPLPDDQNSISDFFVLDTFSQNMIRVTINAAGEEANGTANLEGSSISLDGRYVVFVSAANNLVTGDTNGFRDIFVKEIHSGRIARVNVSDNGVQANHHSRFPVISPDGRSIYFSSLAANLVPGTITPIAQGSYVYRADNPLWYVGTSPAALAIPDQYVAEDTPGSVHIASFFTDEIDPVGGLTYSLLRNTNPSLVTVTHVAGTDQLQLMPLPNLSGTSRIMVRAVNSRGYAAEREFVLHVTPVNDSPTSVGQAFATEVNQRYQGILGGSDIDSSTLTYRITTPPLRGSVIITNPATGAFEYTPLANHYVPDQFAFEVVDSDGAVSNVSQVLVTMNVPSVDLDLQIISGTSLSQLGNNRTDLSSHLLPWSANSRFITFNSHSSNLVTGDTNLQQDAFVKDTQTGAIRRIGTDRLGNQFIASAIAISSDGNQAIFSSIQDNLTPNDNNGQADYFLQNLSTNEIWLIPLDGITALPQVSPELRYLTYTQARTVQINGKTTTINDGFVKDLLTGALKQVNTDATGILTASIEANNGTSLSSISLSADGTLAVYVTRSRDFMPPPIAAYRSDVILKNLLTGEVSVVNTNQNGEAANGQTYGAQISANGRYVSFISMATNLVGNNNGQQQLYRKDLWTNEVLRLSENMADLPGNGPTQSYSLSDDGRYAVIDAVGSNITPDSPIFARRYYVRDIIKDRIVLLDIEGEIPNSTSFFLTGAKISPNSESIAVWLSYTDTISRANQRQLYTVRNPLWFTETPPFTPGTDDVRARYDAYSYAIDLWQAFSDNNDNDDELVFTVTGNTNPAIFSNVQVEPSTGKLHLDFAPGALGTSRITVRATDTAGLFAETTFDAIATLDPGSAQTPNLDVLQGELIFTASDGVANRLSLFKRNGEYVLEDTAQPIIPSAAAIAAGWRESGLGYVTGPLAGLAGIILNTGDQSDQIAIHSVGTSLLVDGGGQTADSLTIKGVNGKADGTLVVRGMGTIEQLNDKLIPNSFAYGSTGIVDLSAAQSITLRSSITAGRIIFRDSALVQTVETLQIKGQLEFVDARQFSVTNYLYTNGFKVEQLNLSRGILILHPHGGAAGALEITGQLTMGTNSVIDLADNDLILHYDPAGTNPTPAITEYVQNFYNANNNAPRISTGMHSQFAGTGIIIPVDNRQARLGDTNTPFLGRVLGDAASQTGFHQVLVRYTHPGDLNLDGQVTTADYLPIDTNLGRTTTGGIAGYLLGDTDFNGVVDGGDYLAIDSYLGQGVGAPLAAEKVALLQSAALERDGALSTLAEREWAESAPVRAIPATDARGELFSQTAAWSSLAWEEDWLGEGEQDAYRGQRGPARSVGVMRR
ncbi:MAG: Ig-like domain-containing protein [Pirellulales bacterium]|nr:Ig-like domain-containing protein [Pirellulales bacterium]